MFSPVSCLHTLDSCCKLLIILVEVRELRNAIISHSPQCEDVKSTKTYTYKLLYLKNILPAIFCICKILKCFMANMLYFFTNKL